MYRLSLFLFSLACSLQLVFAQPEMIRIEKGEFVMGCTDEQKPDCGGDVFPVHAVSLSSFHIGKYEITQSEWESVMGDNPSINQLCGSNCPVENMDWYSILVFCNELTLNDPNLGVDQLVYFKDEALENPWKLVDYEGEGNTTGGDVFVAMFTKGYRLPYEAEWEFAARGGHQASGFKYAGSNNADDVAWYNQNSEDAIHPVGLKNPNEISLYDMSGNVWEKVFDRYAENYEKYHSCDPIGPDDGTNRVSRGGAFQYTIDDSIIASRYFNKPSRSSASIGFRVARYD